MLKAVILIGGPQKGTRFRPLSFDVPKPLFPIAGLPMIQHHIEACVKVDGLKEILLLGFYPAAELVSFISEMNALYTIRIRYLQEYIALGTAGGIYHFRGQIESGNPEAFFILNGDVCGEFPLQQMIEFHRKLSKKSVITMMGTEATRQQSMCYGSIVADKSTYAVIHYVEKPSTFISNLINCGVYVCSPDIFNDVAQIYKRRRIANGENLDTSEAMFLEQDLLKPLAGTNRLHVYITDRWWSQIKTAGSAIYTNRHYLELYRRDHEERLAINEPGKPTIIEGVFVHPSATIDPTAVLGPNVSIGKNVVIEAGVRIRESIILENAYVEEHSCILYSIVGWNSTVGAWARLEGTACDPNPNKPFAKMENVPLFNDDGKLNPSITILGSNVTVQEGVVLLNSIVLPHKDLTKSFKNEIIL